MQSSLFLFMLLFMMEYKKSLLITSGAALNCFCSLVAEDFISRDFFFTVMNYPKRHSSMRVTTFSTASRSVARAMVS